MCQKYNGKIHVIVIDDGSTDDSLKLLKTIDYCTNFMIIKTKHSGKSYALNTGLKYVKTKYCITVDSDTSLHPLAVQNIMDKLVNSDKNVAATAGSIYVQNDKKTLLQNFNNGITL